MGNENQEEKTCSGCYWWDEYDDAIGFCDEKEAFTKEHGYCPKWKDKQR